MQSRETLRNSAGLNYKSAALNQLSYAGENAAQINARIPDLDKPVAISDLVNKTAQLATPLLALVMLVYPTSNGQIDHTSEGQLITPAGRI